MKVRAFLAVVGVCAVAPAFAQLEDSGSGRYFGPEVGVFLPASEKLRNALGSSWFSIGAGSVRTGQFERQKFTWDWNTISQSKSGSKVFMGTVTYGMAIPLGQKYSMTQPYAAVRAGISYIDYAVNVGMGRESAKRFGPNANVEVGIMMNQRLSLAARYDLNPSYDGLGFSGLSLSLRYGLLRF